MAIDIHDDAQGRKRQQAINTSHPQEVSEQDHQTALLREAIYAFLSSVYLHPVTEASLLHISDEQFLNDLAEVLPGEATTELRNYFGALDPSLLSKELAALKQEYMNLFSVPTGRYVAPFEDIYRGKTAEGQPHRGPLLGVRAIAAKQLYREAGARMDNVCKELPNHIGVELSFMHFLCGREASTCMSDALNALDLDDVDSDIYSPAEVYRAYQIRFLNEHLTRWFPQLNEEIQQKSGHVFYRSISNMTEVFLEQDLANLKQQLLDSLQ